MSSDQTPAPVSANAQSPAPAKKRNPIERVIVWGLIVVLLALAAREAVARFGYTNSLNSLQAAMAADDEGQTLMLDQVPSHISGSPTKEADEANHVVSYHWSGLLKDYGSIHIQYSDENEVLGLLTADAPPPETIRTAGGSETTESGEPSDEIAAAGGAPAGAEGSGGGRRGFDFAEADTNGDGKLSPDEAPERMQQRFAEIDTNSDGFVDQEELAARRAARNRDGGERPDRPEPPADAADSGEKEAAAQTDTPDEATTSDESNQPAEESSTPDEEAEQPAPQQ